jgi:hypothetical protein
VSAQRSGDRFELLYGWRGGRGHTDTDPAEGNGV